jgi:hypothetical protein
MAEQIAQEAEVDFKEKVEYWREHGLQVATKGTTKLVEKTTQAADGHKVREIFDPETKASVYHHSNDDSRQDVTVRPETTHIKGLGGH